MKTSETILKQEYNSEFDELRKNRVIVSFYKYGPVAINFGEGLVEAIPTAEQCIQKYKDTGNTEYLLDAANYLSFEFTYPQRPGAFFKGTDADESAGLVGMSIREMEDKYEPVRVHSQPSKL